MNKEKIGKFIIEMRNEKKLSQEQLAKKLNINIRKLNKIEKGKLKPNNQLILDLSKIFNLKNYEIINGYKGNTDIDKNNAISIVMEEMKKRKKYNKVFIFAISILIIIFITILILIYKNRDWGFYLNGESKNFIYNDSMFFYDNGTYFFTFGNIKTKNEEITLDDITYIELKSNDRLIIGSSNILTGITHENKGYDELFPKEVVNNIDNWYYKITYTKNNQTFTEILNIENKKMK